jgi:hypothetical protein
MTSARIARLAIHVGSVGLGLLAFLCIPVGSLRNPAVAVPLLASIQYWTVVWLEGVFERRYHRAPRVMFLVSVLGTKWEDRLISLAYFILALAAGFVVIAVDKIWPGD